MKLLQGESAACREERSDFVEEGRDTYSRREWRLFMKRCLTLFKKDEKLRHEERFDFVQKWREVYQEESWAS